MARHIEETTGRIGMGRRMGRAAMAAAILAATGGCAYETTGPDDVPLVVRDAATGGPVEGVVIVTAVRSTGWFPYAQMESREHPFDKVRVERVAGVDSPGPTLRLPAHLPAAGFVLGWIINERPDVIAFAPGYQVGGQVRVRREGTPTDWSYEQAGYAKGASVEILLARLSPRTASRPARRDGADRTCELLEDQAFWRAFRERARACPRQDLRRIARALLDDAEAIARENPPFVWKRVQQEALDYCRQLSAGGE